jgi:hypothetical protein
MKAILSCAVILFCLSGCHSRPVTTTRENRANSSTVVAYNNLVSRRTLELQNMGGPFKDQAKAHAKAQEEATSQFGGVPADVSTTWAWGKNAGKAEAQEEFTDTLDDMAKDAKRR